MLAFRVNLAQDIFSNHIFCIWFYDYILVLNIVNASVEEGFFIVVTDNLPIYIKRTSNHLLNIVTLPMRNNNFGINKCVSNWITWKWCHFFIHCIRLRYQYGTVLLTPRTLRIYCMTFHRNLWMSHHDLFWFLYQKQLVLKFQLHCSIHQVAAGVNIPKEQLLHWYLIPTASFRWLHYFPVLDSDQELLPCVSSSLIAIIPKHKRIISFTRVLLNCLLKQADV